MRYVLLWALLLSFSAFAKKPVLTYTIAPERFNDKPALEVSVTFKGDKLGKTRLWYQNSAFGEDGLFRCLAQVSDADPRVKTQAVPDSGFILAIHAPGATVTVTYTLVQDFSGPITGIYRPIIQNSWFHVFSQGLLAIPDPVFPKADTRVTVAFEWKGFPENYTIHNSYGTGQRRQEVKLRQEELMSGVFTGGDFRVFPIDVKGYPVYYATRGKWRNLDDAKVVQCLKEAITQQRTFWNDYDFPYFTVTLLPVGMHGPDSLMSFGLLGTAIHQAFAACATNNSALEFQMIRYLFNHELLHTWIGRTIRNTHEELQYWFSEGFTEYYTYQNMLRSGAMTREMWALSFNKDVLAPHYQSAIKNQPNYTIKDKFWSDYEYSKLPYRRGAIFALWLDGRIQAKTKGAQSLDDFMHALLANLKAQNKTLTDEYFLETAQQFLGEDISPFFQKHILCGDPIDFTGETPVRGVTLKVDEQGMPVVGVGY